ncbi:hypothetical protein Peur_036275 [Populus x canadensis]
MRTAYDANDRQFRVFDTGIRMTKSKCEASIFLTRKGEDLGATYSHYFDRERKFAAAAKITRRFSIKENIVMVGGSWTMATLIEHEIKPKSNLTISTVFNAKSLDTFPGIGLILSLVL